jgi:hypothetical protein
MLGAHLPAEATPREWHHTLQSALASMVYRSQDKPGMSWRAGVHPPIEGDIRHLSAQAKAQLVHHLRPAVLRVALTQHAAGANDAMNPHMQTGRMALSLVPVTQPIMAAAAPAHNHGSVVRASAAQLPLYETGADVHGHEHGEAAATPAVLEGGVQLEIWAADLLTSVIELDAHGRMVIGGHSRVFCHNCRTAGWVLMRPGAVVIDPMP